MVGAIDNADHILLIKMQEDVTQSLENLAEASNLSIPSVQRRLKRLRNKKIIDREVAILNPELLGQKMAFIVMVELERERLDQLDSFRRVIRKEPRVQQCYYVTGEADFTLICLARDMADFEDLTHQLFFNNSNVRRFRTSVVMERTKVSLSTPLQESLK